MMITHRARSRPFLGLLRGLLAGLLVAVALITGVGPSATPARAAGPVGWAYLFANQRTPTTDTYTPILARQFNSTGAVNTVVVTGKGAYTARLPNLGAAAGTVHVTAFGSLFAGDDASGAMACKVAFWAPSGTTQQVHVRCFDRAGSPTVGEFALTYANLRGSPRPTGYLWADQPSKPSYTPSPFYQFNSSGAANTVARTEKGAYTARLPNIGTDGTAHVQVTAYGTGSARCQVAGWGRSGTAQQVNVRCFDRAGALTDAQFTLTYVSGISLVGSPWNPNGSGTASAYVLADQPTSPIGTPSTPRSVYRFNSSGGTNTVTRTGTGAYRVNFPGQALDRGTVQVSAFGKTTAAQCKVASWGPRDGVQVRCFAPSGGAKDAAFTATVLASTAPAQRTVVDTSYTSDDDASLRNPERGMYFGSTPNTPEEFHTIVPKWLWLDTVCGVNLVWNGYNQTGTSSVLNAYAAQLEAARTGGYKILFRPRYDKDDNRHGPSDCTINGVNVFHADSVTRQKNHIAAIAAMLGDYKDAIAYIQAGYLGRWGEWNTASYGPDNAPFLHSYATRSEIIDYVLAKYAAEGIQQHVELRRPVFAKQVLDRTASARVGYHNDCFMTNDSDYGTYSNYQSGEPSNFTSSSAAKLWAQQTLTPNASFGGETCPLDPPGAERWRVCANMNGPDSEPASLHMNYLNGDYANDAVTTWTNGGCYNEIRRKLGYRFQVTRVEYPQTVRAGQSFTVHVDVANNGWAKLHKPRNAKIVLRRGSASQGYTLSNSNTASWAPGTTTRLTLTATAPATPGTYSVRLAIPDPDAPGRIPYAVKLATLRGGTNVFDATTGENNLGVSITVQ